MEIEQPFPRLTDFQDWNKDPEGILSLVLLNDNRFQGRNPSLVRRVFQKGCVGCDRIGCGVQFRFPKLPDTDQQVASLVRRNQSTEAFQSLEKVEPVLLFGEQRIQLTQGSGSIRPS